MLSESPTPASSTAAPQPGVAAPNFNRPIELKAFAIAALLVGICFALPLYRLVGFAAKSQLYSHILLIPFISAYLIRLQSKVSAGEKLARATRSSPPAAITFILLGTGLLIFFRVAQSYAWQWSKTDYFCVHTASAVAFYYAACFLLVPVETLRRYTFPLAFLIFAIPFPDRLYHGIETFLQYRSADAAHLLFSLTGMPVWRDGTEFRLPGFSLEVAPECSGIHSSLVLFISSFLAAYMLLRTRWSRIIFVACIIPLGIVRNGFRIWTLGELCVQFSHDWINSELHHRGGPIFFALSLIPLFALLFLLRKLETKNPASRKW